MDKIEIFYWFFDLHKSMQSTIEISSSFNIQHSFWPHLRYLQLHPNLNQLIFHGRMVIRIVTYQREYLVEQMVVFVDVGIAEL